MELRSVPITVLFFADQWTFAGALLFDELGCRVQHVKPHGQVMGELSLLSVPWLIHIIFRPWPMTISGTFGSLWRVRTVNGGDVSLRA